MKEQRQFEARKHCPCERVKIRMAPESQSG